MSLFFCGGARWVHCSHDFFFYTCNSLVTDEDNEDSYLPRPNWAKAIGLDAARKRPQLSSDCEALSDLQEEALYIPRSSVNDFHEIGEGNVCVCVCVCFVCVCVYVWCAWYVCLFVCVCESHLC